MNIFNVAKFFLQRAEITGEEMTHLKLQKLCYYAQAWYLAKTGYRLVPANFEAWDYGPVCPELYQTYKAHGRQAISLYQPFNPYDIFSPEEMRVLDEVWSKYGDESPESLVSLTHLETPWVSVYVRGANNPITDDSMRMYYSHQEQAETDPYERMIREAQEELNRQRAHGEVAEPQEVTMRNLHENYDTTIGTSTEALAKYLEQVR